MLRGLAVVVMALDHVRDFFLAGTAQDPMADPHISPALFATRWITHFCAPTFILLAGTSAGLMAARKEPRELGRFLLTRGAWLILVECVVISTALTFAPFGLASLGGRVLVTMQVIWAIGASMIVLAGAQFLGRRACLVLGLVIACGHNLLDGAWPRPGLFELGAPLWVALHAQMAVTAGPFMFIFVYPLLPWIGVMLIGYGIAGVFELPAERRDALLLRAGLALIAGFLVLRALDGYGDPTHWQAHPAGTTETIIRFLNTTKYPPSLQFLLMALGPAAVLCAYADRITGPVKDALVTFGRVPFAFYVTHFFLLHALSIGLGVAQGFDARQLTTSFMLYPPGYGLSLAGVYAVWVLVVALMYPLCRWVAGVKSRRRDWWLSYL
jgi:uncharacterized membrane protein